MCICCVRSEARESLAEANASAVCSMYSDVESYDPADWVEIYVDVDESEIVADFGGETVRWEIAFCPMCGRRLGGAK